MCGLMQRNYVTDEESILKIRNIYITEFFVTKVDAEKDIPIWKVRPQTGPVVEIQS